MLLDLIDQAVKDGWDHRRACATLELRETRAFRWRRRRDAGRLEDRRPGGNAVHGLLDGEVAEVLAVFEEWSEIDRSHRKLAHRGSYLGRVWVSPASVRRVLAAHGLQLRRPHREGTSKKTPWPDWVTYRPKEMWIYDTTHFTCTRGTSVTAIEDMNSRKWVATIVSGEETSTQVELVFWDALEAEGLLDKIEDRVARRGHIDVSVDDDNRPVLLAISDNGPQMTSGSTREFMALCAIAQHFGRPGTPTDQAWIETLFGHIKSEFPHLDRIKDPEVLRVELEIVRVHYNTVRLHAGIGYVTPNDEHEGRGATIRAARKQGLADARERRIAYHRQQRNDQKPETR
jgi:transposase InsO family protein